MAGEERETKWAAALRLRGLRKRWIVNTILPVLVLLVLLVTLVSVGVSTYYYSSMRDGLSKQVEAMSNSFNDYFMNSYAEYNQMATQAVDTYEDKSNIELQFISSVGRIQMSTSGLTAGTSPGTSDITGAIANQEITPFQGRDPATGEKVLAVSAPLLFNGRVAGVMRLVTSLRLLGSVRGEAPRLPVYAFNIDGKDNGEFANDLSMTYGIEGRPGLHCSPLAHRTLGTFPEGALRLSPGYYTTEDEIDYTIESIRALASK